MFRKTLNLSLVSLALFILLSILFLLGLFSSWQEKLSDNLFLSKKPNPDIVIIAIDDQSIQRIGRWPWDRRIHARLIEKLANENVKPRRLGIDISFFEASDPSSDFALSEALRKHGGVTLAAEQVDSKVYSPIEIFSRYTQKGIANTFPDPDGVTRKIKINHPTYDPFAISLLVNYVSLDDLQTEDEDFMRVNFAGKPGTFTTYSYIDVLEENINLSLFKDKIVLIGATAPDLHDNQIVPTSRGTAMAGVEIHANAINTILTNQFLVPEPQLLTIITLFFLTLIPLVVFGHIRIRDGFIITSITVILYFVYAIISFDKGVIRNLIFPPLAVILAFIGSIVFKYVTETRQKRFLRKAFSFYVAPDVVSQIIENPQMLKLGGEKKRVTVLFSDIEGFTSISEKMEPEELTEDLNKYLTEMTNIVFKHKGVVDKFIGDSVMAFWGAPVDNPNHALDACRAALEMQDVRVGKFKSRIGVNTGEVIVGNMGSDKRFDYTVLGDTVNTASRLESLNKNYSTKILISEHTYEEIQNEVEARKIDTVTVRGKSKAIGVYELTDLKI